MKTRELLIKELGKYGITVISDAECSFSIGDRKFKSKIVSKIYLLKKDHIYNTKIIRQLLLEVVNLLNLNNPTSAEACGVINDKNLNIAIDALYGISDLVKLLSNCNDYKEFIKKHDICATLRKTFDMDILSFSYETLNCISNYRIALDWIYRSNKKIEYIVSLLALLLEGKDKIDGIVIKVAKGVQGPWGNLDLPMAERVFNWDDVSGETYGRDKDKRMQQRYLMGFDTYNKSGKVGEGYYWRELRNEPFSWKDRYDASPYPQLAPGTWR